MKHFLITGDIDIARMAAWLRCLSVSGRTAARMLLLAALAVPAVAAGAAFDKLLLPNGLLVEASDERFGVRDLSREAVQILRQSQSLDLISEGHAPQRTRQLLSGVFSAAWLSRLPGQALQRQAQYSLQRYIYSLASSYLTTQATPPVMLRLAERLRALGQSDWARFCEAMSRDELGHDDELVKDLQSLGIDATAFLSEVRPPNAVALVAYFNRLVDGNDPIAAVGYAYALQRSSLLLNERVVARIEALIPPGVIATRSLRIHSAVGANATHVRETEDFISTLPPAARRTVALAVFETIRIMRSEDDFPGDREVDSLLAAYRRAAR
jgi:hypothetical protein